MRRLRLLHVIVPLLVGGFIYVCWRDPTLPMFRWFDSIGAGPLVQWIRSTTKPIETALPRWLEYSLPNATWVYALTAFMSIVWEETTSRIKSVWLSLGLLLGVGSELGQAAGLIPGSFDVSDLTLCFCAAVLALVATSKIVPIKRSINDIPT